MNKLTEILAPAGSKESLAAAVNAGADAVYVGGNSFGARAYAENFTEEELLSAIDYVHLHGRKIYLTVNTLLKEGEMPLLYDYLAPFPGEYSQICWPDEEFALPVCSAVDYNYYVLNGNCFSSYEWETLYNYFTAQLSQGAHLLRVKFTDPASYQAAYTDMIENGRIEELVRYYMNLQGIPQVEYHYSNMDDLLTLYVML